MPTYYATLYRPIVSGGWLSVHYCFYLVTQLYINIAGVENEFDSFIEWNSFLYLEVPTIQVRRTITRLILICFLSLLCFVLVYYFWCHTIFLSVESQERDLKLVNIWWEFLKLIKTVLKIVEKGPYFTLLKKRLMILFWLGKLKVHVRFYSVRDGRK